MKPEAACGHSKTYANLTSAYSKLEATRLDLKEVQQQYKWGVRWSYIWPLTWGAWWQHHWQGILVCRSTTVHRQDKAGCHEACNCDVILKGSRGTTKLLQGVGIIWRWVYISEMCGAEIRLVTGAMWTAWDYCTSGCDTISDFWTLFINKRHG